MTLDLARFAPENLAKDTLFGGSVNMDWMEAAGENGDGVEVALPPITADILDQHMPDWQADFPLDEFDGDEEERLSAAAEEFTGTDGYYEWKDGFFPMMNYAYPIDLRYGADQEELAGHIDALAGCVTLVTVDDQTYLALTGGGMNLAWNICAAFIACRCMPPLKYLEALPKMAGGGMYASNLPDDVAALVLACIPAAADVLRHKADRLIADLPGFIHSVEG